MEGYVKYQAFWQAGPPPDAQWLEPLRAWRRQLYALGLIGALPSGVGFGNLSRRLPPGGRLFAISGTQTGHLPDPDASAYCEVSAFDLTRNTLHCTGPVPASSEALTHAAIYAADPACGAVLHVHDGPLWEALLGRVPTTAPEAAYGTPDMAAEVMRLAGAAPSGSAGLIVMAGHETGLLAYGPDADAAGTLLLQTRERHL
jgi:hypothetical protein